MDIGDLDLSAVRDTASHFLEGPHLGASGHTWVPSHPSAAPPYPHGGPSRISQAGPFIPAALSSPPPTSMLPMPGAIFPGSLASRCEHGPALATGAEHSQGEPWSSQDVTPETAAAVCDLREERHRERLPLVCSEPPSIPPHDTPPGPAGDLGLPPGPYCSDFGEGQNPGPLFMHMIHTHALDLEVCLPVPSRKGLSPKTTAAWLERGSGSQGAAESRVEAQGRGGEGKTQNRTRPGSRQVPPPSLSSRLALALGCSYSQGHPLLTFSLKESCLTFDSVKLLISILRPNSQDSGWAFMLTEWVKSPSVPWAYCRAWVPAV